MSDELSEFFNLNGTQIGNLAASYFYAYLIMQVPAGILLDEFGPRKVLSVCLFAAALGTLILSLSTHYWLAFSGRFLTGLGAAAAVIGSMKVITQWFPKRQFALMAGLIMTMGMLGAVNGQAPLAFIVQHIHWQRTLFYIALIGFILCFLFMVFSKNQGPYSIPAPIKQHSPFTGLLYSLSKSQPWLLSIYSGLTCAPLSVFGGLWGVPFLEVSNHFSKLAAAQAISMIFIGFAVGCPLLGGLSDYIGKRLIIVKIGTICALILACLVVYIPHLSLPMTDSMLFAFGFSLSVFLLSFTMIQDITPMIFVATALGFMNSFDAALGAISDPAIGFMLDHFNHSTANISHHFSLHSYHIGMTLLIIYLAAAVLILPFIKETISSKQSN